MKRIFFLLLAGSVSVYAGGLKVDLSRYTNYKSYDVKGLTLVLHQSIYRDNVKTWECLSYWGDAFSRIEKICPNTIAHFKNNKYRLYLYSLPSSRGGMEFIRDGQYRWDKRMTAYVNRGIIIPRARFYLRYNQRENGLVYLLHEMAHYRHVVMIEENGRGYDRMIQVEYRKAMRNPLYRGTYASKNYLEYFAEISMAYLLKKHTVSTFPSGSKQLYEKDRVGYNLCREIWGKDLAAYKPRRQEPRLIVATDAIMVNPPVRPMTDVYSVSAGNTTFQDRLMIHATKTFERPSEGTVLISKKFLEIKRMMSKAETEELLGNYAMSSWLYSNSLTTLNNFKKENPYWNTSVIDGMINRVKPKIN